jgi:hypothetical protein
VRWGLTRACQWILVYVYSNDRSYFGLPSRTVLAADGGKVEDVELAALRNAAGAEGRVDLGQGDGGACGEGEDGGGELHGESGLGVG